MPDRTQDGFVRELADALSSPESDRYDEAIAHLRDLPPEPLREVFTALLDDPEPTLAHGAARAVGILEYTEAADLLMDLVEEPGKWFGHDDRAAIRLAAVESLGLLGDPRAVGVLLNLLHPSPVASTKADAELQLEAVRALGRIASPVSVRPLLEAMLSHPPIALSAAGALAEIGGEEAFQGLVDGLSHKDEMIRSATVWALGETGDERAIGPLLDLSRSADPLLRRDIAWALGRIGGLPARIGLGTLCRRDPDLGVRQEAARAIQRGAVIRPLWNDPSSKGSRHWQH